MKQNKSNDSACWGGFRKCSGRKKTCAKKVSFNRRINEDILNILKIYAKKHNLTDTEALERAILVQYNLETLKGEKNMKIVIPSKDEKLCGHFGNCDYFTFVEVNPETKEILSIEKKVPEEGISCQSASWIASKGANVVLAGGMGMRPMNMFIESGVNVISGCPEENIEFIVNSYMNNTLKVGQNTCSGGHHNHSEGGHCSGHCHH